MIRLALIGEYLTFAWETFKANKIRVFLTTLSVLIGVAAIIFIFSLIQSINRYVTSEFADIGSTTLYVSKFPWVITGNYWELRNRPPVTLREYQALKRGSDYARWISPVFETTKPVKYRNKTLEQVIVVGTNEQYPETRNTSVAEGRWFTRSEVKSARKVCVIGVKVKEELFSGQNPIGKRVKIDEMPYKVIGVLEKKGDFFGFNLDSRVVIPYTTVKGLSSSRRSITIALKVADIHDLENLKSEIRGILRKVRKLSPRDADNFAINQQDMLTDFYKKITGTSFLVILFIAAISLVVGGIGVMNIMLVSVTERTREIGIRKAVGATRSQIMAHFLTESVVICLIGGVMGLILGVGLAQIPIQLMGLPQGMNVWTALVGFGFAVLVGIVSGWYPAFKASRLNPIEALRYE